MRPAKRVARMMAEEKWEILHLYAPFVGALFSGKPVLVMLLVYVWETTEEILFDCCELFDDDTLLRHEPLTNSLIVDPLQGVIGIVCGLVLRRSGARVSRRCFWASNGNVVPFVLSFVVVFAGAALSGLYTYRDRLGDDDAFPWGYSAFVVIAAAFLLLHDATADVYAHSALLLLVPWPFDDTLVGSWVAAGVSVAAALAL